ncbi:uncharacterized protein LOC143223737 isoform X2 [Tachypleus tridentatus]|uniref:uncharacterized protein LOC143223737 isoform X2 n=1 Tax=Tachypleus tridentatus TaxID=6853 RepID=UPI003FD1DCEA
MRKSEMGEYSSENNHGVHPINNHLPPPIPCIGNYKMYLPLFLKSINPEPNYENSSNESEEISLLNSTIENLEDLIVNKNEQRINITSFQPGDTQHLSHLYSIIPNRYRNTEDSEIPMFYDVNNGILAQTNHHNTETMENSKGDESSLTNLRVRKLRFPKIESGNRGKSSSKQAVISLNRKTKNRPSTIRKRSGIKYPIKSKAIYQTIENQDVSTDRNDSSFIPTIAISKPSEPNLRNKDFRTKELKLPPKFSDGQTTNDNQNYSLKKSRNSHGELPYFLNTRRGVSGVSLNLTPPFTAPQKSTNEHKTVITNYFKTKEMKLSPKFSQIYAVFLPIEKEKVNAQYKDDKPSTIHMVRIRRALAKSAKPSINEAPFHIDNRNSSKPGNRIDQFSAISDRNPDEAETRFYPSRGPYGPPAFPDYPPFFGRFDGPPRPTFNNQRFFNRGFQGRAFFPDLHRPQPRFYHGAETKRFRYGLLGSGNFDIIRGGIFAFDEPTPFPRHGLQEFGFGNNNFPPFNYDPYSNHGPTLGFQGFNNFPNSLINALSEERITSANGSTSSTTQQLTRTTDDLMAED